MAGFTQAQAQAQLDALMAAQSDNLLGGSVGGRSFQFRSAEDLQAQINYWSRIVAGFQREAAGRSRHGFSVAKFT